MSTEQLVTEAELERGRLAIAARFDFAFELGHMGLELIAGIAADEGRSLQGVVGLPVPLILSKDGSQVSTSLHGKGIPPVVGPAAAGTAAAIVARSTANATAGHQAANHALYECLPSKQLPCRGPALTPPERV